MPVYNHPPDTTHYETYETCESGEFIDNDGERWTEKLTYSDGSVCYGRSHAPKYQETRKRIGCGQVLGVVVLVVLLTIAVWLFMTPL